VDRVLHADWAFLNTKRRWIPLSVCENSDRSTIVIFA
jgi:hypothetical protein